jgi:hypothetical protein
MLVKTVRGIRLASTSGVIRMAPGTQRDLQGEYLAEALKKGAYPVQETAQNTAYVGAKFTLTDEPDMTEDEQAARDPAIPRDDRIMAAVRSIMERNDASALTGQGTPRVRDVAALIGDEVTREEIDLALTRVT